MTPERIIIDYATRCNLRCGMCPVWGQTEDDIAGVKGLMDLAAARRMLDRLDGARPMVLPSLFGEPLLIPGLLATLRDLKARGLPVVVNTNGLTLTEELAAALVALCDSIMVSIDAVTPATLKAVRGIDKLAKVEQAAQLLLAMRDACDAPARIGVSFTTQEANRHEEETFVARWLKMDVVRVGCLYEHGSFPDMPDPGPRKPCPAIYKTMAIHNTGQVTICCLDALRQTDMGNVFETSIAEVWNGPAFTAARAAHEAGEWDKVPFCKGCNGWAQYDFTEEITPTHLIRRSPQYTYYNRLDRLATWLHRGGHQ